MVVGGGQVNHPLCSSLSSHACPTSTPTHTPQAREAGDALARLEQERAAITGEKEAAVAAAAALQAQVEALRQEVVEARGAGTPHGEAAKTVSRLALEKIKKLQVGGPRRAAQASCGGCMCLLDR